jgi:Curli production assembly/transport component CsgG
MNMQQKKTFHQFALAVFCLLAVVITAYPQRKPRVAVLNFSGEEGQRITDWAIIKLGESKDYTLILRDKSELAQVLEEIDKGGSDYFNNPTKVPFGKLAGVEILIFGRVDAARLVQPGPCRLLPRPVCQGKFTGQVKLMVKLVKTATGEIVETVEAEGAAKGTDALSMVDGKNDDEFRKVLLNKATADAVGKFAVKLQDLAKGLQMPAEPPSPKSVVLAPGEGMVVDVEGSQISIYLPATAGTRPGEKWKIRRFRKDVTAPNGDVIGKHYDEVGEVIITDVQPKMLVGSYSGAKPALKNDSALKVTVIASPPAKKIP